MGLQPVIIFSCSDICRSAPLYGPQCKVLSRNPQDSQFYLASPSLVQSSHCCGNKPWWETTKSIHVCLLSSSLREIPNMQTLPTFWWLVNHLYGNISTQELSVLQSHQGYGNNHVKLSQCKRQISCVSLFTFCNYMQWFPACLLFQTSVSAWIQVDVTDSKHSKQFKWLI